MAEIITIDGHHIDREDRELKVEIRFSFYKGMRQTYWEPAEPASIEIQEIVVKAGKYSALSIGGEQYRTTIEVFQDFELDDDWIEEDTEAWEELEQQCWDWINEEARNR